MHERHKDAGEVEREHIAAMGPTLGPIYHRLYNECVYLNLSWRQYVILYGESPERLKLLNGSSGIFFRIVQDALWEDTLLSLSRLTDPADSPGKKSKKSNLTIQQLPQLVNDLEEKRDLQLLVDAAVISTAFARDWRNRHIAHRDLPLALNQSAEPLAQASQRSVKEAIAAVCTVIQRLGPPKTLKPCTLRGTGPPPRPSLHQNRLAGEARELPYGCGRWPRGLSLYPVLPESSGLK